MLDNLDNFDKLANIFPPMRRTLTAADAKNRFAEALRQAEIGDLIVITRYRKPVAALVGGERLERLERIEDAPGKSEDAKVAGDVDAAETTTPRPTPEEAMPTEPTAAEPTLRKLRDRAAAGSLRRIEADLARVPERLQPALRLIRANLFHPRLNVERLQAVLQVGAHDFTTEFHRAAGAPIYQYLTDRRLEAVARLLVDTDLGVRQIGRLTGYPRLESLSRAFKTRYGVRPSIYREFSGKLSPEVASDRGADRPPPLPRYLAGTAAVAKGATCGRCGDELEAGTAPRVFEDLAPICARCARERAPDLARS